MMASLVSSWKSQRHLDLRCPRCIFLILWPGILPGFLLRDWYHPSILFCKTGNLASFSAPPLYPGHYQVMSAVPSKYLWIISMPSHCDLQVQAMLCLSPVLLQMQMTGLLTFTFFFFIYFWLCWVFVSVRGLSPVAASGVRSSSRCAGLSLSRPLPLRSTGSRCADSVVVAHGLSCSVACGIFPDQGSNPCPLRWQADS